MALQIESLPTSPGEFQAYCDELNDEELERLDKQFTTRFAELASKEDPDEDHVEKVTAMKGQIDIIRGESARRESAAANQKAQQAAAAHRAAITELADSVLGTKSSKAAKADDDPDGDSGDGDGEDATEALASTLTKAMELAVSRVEPVVASGSTDLNRHIRDIPLSQIGRQAPDPKVAPARREAVLVAAADIPGVARNGRVDGVNQLVKLMGDRARMMTVSRGTPNYVNVAKMERDFRYRLSQDSTPEEVNEVLTAATDTAALVAAGGWCASSEISYDFFNIVCEDGLLDIPSVGILNRGGFRFPTSPSIADIFSDPNVLWSWTEDQDISAADNGDIKTCARVPCPEFEEVRALCDGLCVTAGNLTDYAYPELIANYLRLVMAGRAHRTNQLVIQQLVDASGAAIDMTGSGEGTASSVLNSVELQAIDYRERYRMCEDAIIEVVFPRWVLGAIRADLANRNGVDLLAVTNGMIADWFNLRNIRVQFVSDWQAGFDGDAIGDPDTVALTWPTTVNYLLYAPGTFVRGQALQLDLGVVRDSTLNEKNDHTAAWLEDCYAVAQIGHESRLVTTDVCTAGETGAQTLTCGS